MQLRDYQQDAFRAVNEGWGLYQKQLGIMATGGGKTILFSHLAATDPGKVLILAHREELINQAVDKLYSATGIHAAVEQGTRKAIPGSKVTVASVQTMRGRKGKYAPDHFSLIIVDECQHRTSREYMDAMEHFQARELGVTATPSRSDKKELSRVYQSVAFNFGMLELIKRGYLSDVRIRRLKCEVDIRQLRLRKEFNKDEVAEVLHPVIKDMARELAAESWFMKLLVFLPRCDVSHKFAHELAKLGLEAAHISGACKDREAKLKWFSKPGPKVLCNAMLLTEGFDQPDVDGILVGRPILSPSLYAQIVGRGTRLSPGKSYCTVFDPLWLSGRHDICKAACLTAETELHRERLQVALDLGMDFLEAEERAQRDVEEALAKQLREAARPKPPKGFIDPLKFALAIHDTDLAEYEPITQDELQPATLAELSALASYKMWAPDISHGQARALLTVLNRREDNGLASPAMVMRLRGIDPNASIMSRSQAIQAMNRRFHSIR